MKDKTILFKEGSVFRSVLSLALPSVMGQIILVIYNLADMFFIGMTDRSDMIAAAAVVMPAFMFLSALSNLFGVGGEAVICRCLGSGDRRSASGASSFSILGCAAATSLYCLTAFLFRNGFIDLLGGSHPAVHGFAKQYLVCAVVIFGIPTSMSMVLSHLLRSEGRAVSAAAGIAGGGILNILLDPLFMFRLLPEGSEVLGAALATGLSNLIACVFYAVMLFSVRRESVLTAKIGERTFSPDLAGEILATGGPACIMTLFENISYAVLDKLISFAGTAAQAGIGIAKKVNMLPHSFVRGISQGILPMMAYNYSAGDHRRMKDTLRIGILLGMITALVCMAVCLTETGILCGIFLDMGDASFAHACRFLRILCLGCPFSAGAYLMISFFQAAGRPRHSLALALMRKGILDIPLMFLLYRFFSAVRIVWATPAVDLICFCAAAAMYAGFGKQLR